jgi:hypothetical protein
LTACVLHLVTNQDDVPHWSQNSGNLLTTNAMKKLINQKVWQAIACLACASVLWLYLDEFGASEFSGGWLTGPLLRMADLASLLFLVALLLTFFLRRIAASIALAATLLCLPFYLYILMPGAYRWIFKGEYSVPLNRPFHWDNWAVVGMISLLFVVILSLRSYSRVQVDV